MAHIPGENREVVDACRRRDGEVGEAGRVTSGTCQVHWQPRAACCGNIERHHPIAIDVENSVEPVVEAFGSCVSARSPQPGYAVGNLGNGDRLQEQFFRTSVQPNGHGDGAFQTFGGSHRENVRIDEIHGRIWTPTLWSDIACRARVARRQIAFFKPGGGKEAAERRDLVQAVPFVEADKDGPGLSSTGDDGSLALRCSIRQG